MVAPGADMPLLFTECAVQNVNCCCVPCLVDPDKPGERLLDACWDDNVEEAVRLIGKREYICSVTHGVITDSRHNVYGKVI